MTIPVSVPGSVPGSVPVSVIVPAYNRAHLIGETLEHILRQTSRPFEIIVADDGSTDATAAEVRRFGQAVTTLSLRNHGAPAARHAAVRASSGRFIAFCDSDDLWEPDHLARLGSLFAASNRLDYAFANFREFNGPLLAETTKFDRAPQGYWDRARRHTGDESWIIDGGFVDNLVCFQPIFPSAVMMSRAHYDAVGGFNPAMSHVPSEDLEFTLRCVRSGPIGVIARPTVRIRKHAGNTSHAAARQVIGEICILNHVLNHHGVSGFTRAYIMEDLERRCRDAIDLSFACGDMELVRLLNSAVERTGLSARQRLKIRIAGWPHPIGPVLNALVTPDEIRRLKATISTYLRQILARAVADIRARQGHAIGS